MNVLPPRARDDHDHAVRDHQSDHGHALSANRCDHVREYVYVGVRENVHECVYESVLCLHECVRAHVHACVCVSANDCVHAFLSFHFSFQKNFTAAFEWGRTLIIDLIRLYFRLISDGFDISSKIPKKTS
ncbi:MAG: hypothetical protein PVH36_15085 [Desulfobacterales bacterium]